MWVLNFIFVFCLLVYVACKSSNTMYHHYCDTCKHGIWSRDRCYCNIRKQSIQNIKSNAGCNTWVCRR